MIPQASTLLAATFSWRFATGNGNFGSRHVFHTDLLCTSYSSKYRPLSFSPQKPSVHTVFLGLPQGHGHGHGHGPDPRRVTLHQADSTCLFCSPKRPPKRLSASRAARHFSSSEVLEFPRCSGFSSSFPLGRRKARLSQEPSRLICAVVPGMQQRTRTVPWEGHGSRPEALGIVPHPLRCNTSDEFQILGFRPGRENRLMAFCR